MAPLLADAGGGGRPVGLLGDAHRALRGAALVSRVGGLRLAAARLLGFHPALGRRLG